MGYAPTSEDWYTELEQVLRVRYVHAPAQGPAVLAALAAAEAELALPAQEPPPPVRRGFLERAPLLDEREVKQLAVVAIIAISLGVVVALIVSSLH
jgi:hypothetical protein